MGIKGWLTVGGALLTGIAVWLGLKKKEDEHYERIQKMIRDVDRKEPETEEETAEKVIDDIERSFREMGLDDEADAYAAATAELGGIAVHAEETLKNVVLDNGETAKEWIDRNFEKMMKNADQNADDVLKAGQRLLHKANEMLNDSETNRQKQKEIEEKIKVIDNSEILEAARLQKENEAKIKELKEKQNDPEWIAEQERIRKELEEKAEADYKRKVKKAVEQKNWSKLEDLFDSRYADGPWHPSPASVYSAACSHGDISEEIVKMAEEYYGKLWCYSGD